MGEQNGAGGSIKIDQLSIGGFVWVNDLIFKFNKIFEFQRTILTGTKLSILQKTLEWQMISQLMHVQAVAFIAGRYAIYMLSGGTNLEHSV